MDRPSASPAHAPDPLLAGFTGPLPEVRVGAVYRWGLALVAFAMVLLPLIYVGLIGLLGYGLYWHATANAAMWTTDDNPVFYLVVLFVGGVMVLFMIKPLFAPRVKAMEPLVLTPEAEPRLHGFIYRLCEVVGAPRPRLVVADCQANASAGFRGGPLSLVRNDLVLTIGLPLVGGLPLRSLAGVLAHEFGHFAQKTGMRVTYIIRSVNEWFARVVYHRDVLDDLLHRAGGTILYIAIPVWFALFFVYLTRGVLWVLMMMAHALSCFMLRQMEYDADRYEAHLSGSEDYARTARRLPYLAVGVAAAEADLEESMHRDRLVDDFVALALENETNLPAEVREQLHKHLEEETTGLLDTHPATAERIASVEALNAPGRFTYEGPATELFTDFEALSRKATRELYAAVLGEEAARHALVPFAEFVLERDAMLDEFKTLNRYFQEVVHPLRPLLVPTGSPGAPGDFPQLEAELRSNRDALLRGVEEHRTQFKVLDGLDDRRLQIRVARGLIEADLEIEHEAFELHSSSLNAVGAAQAEVDYEVGNLLPQMARTEEPAARRFWAAMSLARMGVGAPEAEVDPAGGDGADADDQWGPAAQAEELERLLSVLHLLTPLLPQLVILRDETQALIGQAQQLEEHSGHGPLQNAVSQGAYQLRGLVQAFGAALGDTPDPLDPQHPPQPLWRHLLGEPPPDDDELAQAIVPAQSAVERGYRVYNRVLGRLAIIAERVEATLGLDPLEEPPEPEIDWEEDDEL